MVHVNRVATRKEITEEQSQFKAIEATTSINLTPDDEDDDFTATVYGSKYAAEDLPRHEMPEREMPPHVAYRMIKDDLTLDGTPTLNLASFVTTYMEEEAEKLMVDAFSKNFIDYEEYPVSADIQNRCVSMIARLFNAPCEDDANTIGTSTIGSSEAIMLGVLAMKKLWQNKRKAEGKPYDKPNMIMNSAVQVCWEVCKPFSIDPGHTRRSSILTVCRKHADTSKSRSDMCTARLIAT
jgi:glutamate decarboxylase